MRETSTLRRPLITFGTVVIVVLIGAMSLQALASRSVFTGRSDVRTVTPGWVVVGVRAPESAGGTVALVPVGQSPLRARPWQAAEVAQLLNRNDVAGLMDYAAGQLQQPVSGAVVLDRLALAGLIDAVGGPDAEIAGEVGVADGDALAIVDAVLADRTGGRLLRVWTAICTTLPADDERVRGVVVSLGSALRATEGAHTVAHWLSEWRAGL